MYKNDEVDVFYDGSYAYDSNLFELCEYEEGFTYLRYIGKDTELTLPDECQSIYGMFSGNAVIPKILHGIEHVKMLTSAFKDNPAEVIDISEWDVSNIQNASFAFMHTSAKEIKLPQIWRSLEYADGFLRDNKFIESISLNFGKSKLHYFDSAFLGCTSLKDISICNEAEFFPWMTSSFCGCDNLECLNISNVKYERVNTDNYIHIPCGKVVATKEQNRLLKKIDPSSVVKTMTAF